jgi:hypothetical protein
MESQLLAGLMLLACFAMPNIVGTIMWARRDRVAPYPAIQILVVVVFIFTAVALVSTDCLDVPGRLDPRVKDPKFVYLLLLLFPALMIMFHFINRPRSSRSEDGS